MNVIVAVTPDFLATGLPDANMMEANVRLLGMIVRDTDATFSLVADTAPELAPK